MTIPAFKLVNIVPSVINAGALSLGFNGVILTNNVALAPGAPRAFYSAGEVAEVFGAESIEAKMSAIYFSGFSSGANLPAKLYFAYFDTGAPPPPPPPVLTFSMAVDPESYEIHFDHDTEQPVTNLAFNLVITRDAGFTGPITLAFDTQSLESVESGGGPRASATINETNTFNTGSDLVLTDVPDSVPCVVSANYSEWTPGMQAFWDGVHIVFTAYPEVDPLLDVQAPGPVVTLVLDPAPPPPPPPPPVSSPTITAPVEVEFSSDSHTGSVTLPEGITALWTITGGTITAGATTDTVTFSAGTDPFVDLTCTLSNGTDTASSTTTIIALPFAPRDYLADLRAQLVTYGSAISTEVASNDVGEYYSTSYYIHGMIAAAEVTGDTAIMDQLLGYVSGILSSAQPFVRNGTTYQELPPWESGSPVYPQQLQTYQISSALARVAAVINLNPALKAVYSTEMQQIIDFLDQSIFQYWYNKQTGVYADPGSSWLGGDISWLPVDLGGWGSYPNWNDKCSHFGTMSTWMYQATGSALYREYAQRIATGFRRHVTVHSGSWIWDYGTIPISEGGNLDGSPDTSHANREPMMVMAMHEAGIEFTVEDIQSMASTLVNIIWNQSESSPAFNNYIDGGNLGFVSLGPWQNGNVYLGWNALGRYSKPAERAMALAYQKMITSPGVNPSIAMNAGSYGDIEMSGTLLRNSR